MKAPLNVTADIYEQALRRCLGIFITHQIKLRNASLYHHPIAHGHSYTSLPDLGVIIMTLK